MRNRDPLRSSRLPVSSHAPSNRRSQRRERGSNPYPARYPYCESAHIREFLSRSSSHHPREMPASLTDGGFDVSAGAMPAGKLEAVEAEKIPRYAEGAHIEKPVRELRMSVGHFPSQEFAIEMHGVSREG